MGKERILWTAKHYTARQQKPCLSAFNLVQEQCPGCGLCFPQDVGCEPETLIFRKRFEADVHPSPLQLQHQSMSGAHTAYRILAFFACTIAVASASFAMARRFFARPILITPYAR